MRFKNGSEITCWIQKPVLRYGFGIHKWKEADTNTFGWGRQAITIFIIFIGITFYHY